MKPLLSLLLLLEACGTPYHPSLSAAGPASSFNFGIDDAYWTVLRLSPADAAALDNEISQMSFAEVYRLLDATVSDADVTVAGLARGGSRLRLKADADLYEQLGQTYATLGDYARAGHFPVTLVSASQLRQDYQALAGGTPLALLDPVKAKDCPLHAQYEQALGVTRYDIAAALEKLKAAGVGQLAQIAPGNPAAVFYGYHTTGSSSTSPASAFRAYDVIGNSRVSRWDQDPQQNSPFYIFSCYSNL